MPRGYTYVISDVHGCFDQFVHVLALSGFAANDRLFVLGDAIDRGPKSVDMIKWLLHAPSNVTYMLGNHELMMLEDIRDPASTTVPPQISNWGYNGGDTTGRQMMEGLSFDERLDYFDLCRTLSPAAVVKYRDANNGGFLTESYLIHAGCFLDEELITKVSGIADLVSRQSLTDLVWERDTWLGSGWKPPIPVIFGHTPVHFAASYFRRLGDDWPMWSCGRSKPTESMLVRGENHLVMRWGNHIDIDCGCVYQVDGDDANSNDANSGKLACLRLEDMHVFYSDNTEEELPEG